MTTMATTTANCFKSDRWRNLVIYWKQIYKRGDDRIRRILVRKNIGFRESIVTGINAVHMLLRSSELERHTYCAIGLGIAF
jgi:hypothetical protein